MCGVEGDIGAVGEVLDQRADVKAGEDGGPKEWLLGDGGVVVQVGHCEGVYVPGGEAEGSEALNAEEVPVKAVA